MRYTLLTLAFALFAPMTLPLHAVESTSDEASGAKIGLDGYQLALGPVKIEKIQDNTSGLTFNKDTKTLLAAVNSPTQLVELSRDGETRRVVRLTGFDDTEAVVHFGGKTFGVAEERRFRLAWFELDAAATEVSYDDAKQVSFDTSAGNSGFEGLAYDAATKRLLGVKEKNPLKVYLADDVLGNGEDVEISEPWDAQDESFGLGDWAGLHFDKKSGHLLIVSHESRAVVEVTLAGKQVSRLSLKKGSAGLEADIPQPEGVAMDGEGNLYLCSEPNLFFRFEKSP